MPRQQRDVSLTASTHLVIQPAIKCALNPIKGNIRQLPHLKCNRKCKPRSLGQNVKILAARFCSTRIIEVHLDLILFAISSRTSGLFSQLTPGKNMGKAILGGFFHLKACWFLHVTSRPARGLPRCKQHCFQYATPRTSTKEANEPKAALRPKGCPEKSSSIPEKLYETSVLENRQRWNMRNHNFHVKNVGATCCRRLRCLHTSAWWPRSDSLSGFLLTSYERNATGKLMERAVSCIQHACTKDSKRMMDMRKPLAFLELQQVCCTGLLYKNRLKASNESKNGTNVSNTARESNVTGAVLPLHAMSAYAPRVLGLIYIPMKLL